MLWLAPLIALSPRGYCSLSMGVPLLRLSPPQPSLRSRYLLSSSCVLLSDCLSRTPSTPCAHGGPPTDLTDTLANPESSRRSLSRTVRNPWDHLDTEVTQPLILVLSDIWSNSKQNHHVIDKAPCLCSPGRGIPYFSDTFDGDPVAHALLYGAGPFCPWRAARLRLSFRSGIQIRQRRQHPPNGVSIFHLIVLVVSDAPTTFDRVGEATNASCLVGVRG